MFGWSVAVGRLLSRMALPHFSDLVVTEWLRRTPGSPTCDETKHSHSFFSIHLYLYAKNFRALSLLRIKW
jgi:hypothetical protein